MNPDPTSTPNPNPASTPNPVPAPDTPASSPSPPGPLDFEQMLRQLEAAKDDRDAQLLLTAQWACASLEPNVPGVSLFEALEAAAVPHWFDPAVLERILYRDATSVRRLHEALILLPMVEGFKARGGWNVHESTRLALRRRLAREEHRERLVRLSGRAMDGFPGDEPHRTIERLYHQLIHDPTSGVATLIETYERWWYSGPYSASQSLGFVLEELVEVGGLTPEALAEALLATVQIRRESLLLEERTRRCREALEFFRTQGDGRGLAESLGELGDCFVAGGEQTKALETFRERAEVLKRLISREPKNPRWQHELAVSHSRIGDVFMKQRNLKQGNLDGALAEFRSTHEIIKRLAAMDPDNARWQRDLAVSHNKIGDVFMKQEDFDGAMEEFRKGLEIDERLAAMDPDNVLWQRDLAVSHSRVGDVFMEQEDFDGAMEEFRKDLVIAERLAALDPGNAAWQHDLAVSFQNTAQLAIAKGDSEEGRRLLSHCREVLRGMKRNAMHLDPPIAGLLERLERDLP